MAVSLSTNLSSACTPPPPCRLSNTPSQHHHHQIKTLAAPATALQHQYRPNNLILGSNTPNLFGNLYSSRCRPSLAFQNFTPQGYDSPCDARTPGSSAESRQKPSLKSLFNVYKEAIRYRDLETISEVEAVISSFENEKNELLQKVENEKNDLLLKVENEKNELLQKLADMSAEISSGKEKFIRLQADFDNFRKRSEKERLTVRSDAQGEVLESILPMVDSFERAKQQIKPETERETRIDSSYQGIYKQFVEIMRSLRVAAVPTVGKPFDPSMHEAIAREESLEFKEGIVIQELRRGFLLGSRLLRPAMVKVSSGPGKIKVADRSSAASAGLDER